MFAIRTTTAVVAIVVSTAAAALAQTASGTFTVNKKPTKLAFAYAIAQPGSFDEKKEDVAVILSATKLPEASLLDEGDRMRVLMMDKPTAVVVILSAEKQATSTMLYHPDLSMQISFSGTSQKVDLTTFDGKTVEGRLYLEQPGSMEKDTYHFDATFKAPILRKKIPTAAELKAMADSPAAKAALAFHRVARTGNVAALKAAVVPEMAKELDGPEGKQIVEMLKVTSLDKPTVADVSVAGDVTTVKLEQKSEGGKQTITMRLKEVGGKWLVVP
jgi:hypothetical protein